MKEVFKFNIWCILVILFFVISSLTFFINSTFSETNSQTNLEKLNLPFSVNFSEKEKKFINSLSQSDLEKLIRVIKLIIEKSKNQVSQNICNTEACKKQQLQEKCAKEKSQLFTISNECKLLELGTIGELAKGLVGNPSNNIDQAKLEADRKKAQELKEETSALTTTEKNTPYFSSLVGQAQQGKLPVYSDSVLNQTNLVGTPDFYDGKFVCNTSNGGTFAGNERPRNQGGRVANSLFYAIANAAKASGAQVGSFGCYNYRTIAGSGRLSQHATGDACDVVLKGNDAKNTAFMIFFSG